MLSRGEMAPQVVRGGVTRYVYVKMLTAQADTQEGKLVKGQIVVIPEDKASRWCFRARIARPATKVEYNKYMDRMEMIASRSGGGVRLRRSRVVDIPEENPFEYADAESPEWGDAEVDEDDVTLTGGEPTLSDRLSSVNESSTEDEDEDDEDTETATYPGDSYHPPTAQPGAYNEAISRGPGEAAENRPRARVRGRGAKTEDE